jgi:hypothetical protein
MQPGLAVVLISEDPESQVYVRNKSRQTIEAGAVSYEHRFPADTQESALRAGVEREAARKEAIRKRRSTGTATRTRSGELLSSSPGDEYATTPHERTATNPPRSRFQSKQAR